MAVGLGTLLKQRQEVLNSAIDRTAVNHEAALGEPFDDVGVAQTVANVPAHSQGDDIIREGMMGKRTR
jgi:hypothetical protein